MIKKDFYTVYGAICFLIAVTAGFHAIHDHTPITAVLSTIAISAAGLWFILRFFIAMHTGRWRLD